MPFGELALRWRVGGVLALALALAGALPDPARGGCARSRPRSRPLGLADRAGRADELHAHRDRAGRVRLSINSGCRNSARTSIRGHSATHNVQCSAPSARRCDQCSSRASGRRGVRGDRAVLRVGVRVALALPPPPRVIPVADRGSEATAGQHSGDGDPGPVEQLDQLPDLPGEHGERTRVAAAETRDRGAVRRGGARRSGARTAARAPRRRRRRGRSAADRRRARRGGHPAMRPRASLRAGSRRARRRRRGACARSSDSPDRRVVPRERGEAAAVFLKALLALLRAEQRERAATERGRAPVYVPRAAVLRRPRAARRRTRTARTPTTPDPQARPAGPQVAPPAADQGLPPGASRDAPAEPSAHGTETGRSVRAGTGTRSAAPTARASDRCIGTITTLAAAPATAIASASAPSPPARSDASASAPATTSPASCGIRRPRMNPALGCGANR